MLQAEYHPQRFNTVEWYEHTRTWTKGNRFDAEAVIAPATAVARQAEAWEITVRLGKTRLEPGDHIAIEVNLAWVPDRGRPYVHGRLSFREEWLPGYNAFPRLELPDGVEVKIGISAPERMNRYFIIDAVIATGIITVDSVFKIFLADPDGTLLRCPWFAQDVKIPVAIRKAAEKHYHCIRKYPVVHVRGAYPRLWKAAATLQPDHNQARVQVIAADLENLNPVDVDFSPTLLSAIQAEGVKLERESGYHDAPVWRGYFPIKESTRCPEFFNRREGMFGRSNPVVPEFYEGMQVYFGDIHGQSDRSIGYGTEKEYFWWARDGELLDFTAPANHYGGRENVTRKVWDYTLNLCEEFNVPDRFVTLFAYEWNGQSAHRNIYYRGKAGELYDAHRHGLNRVAGLWAALKEQNLPVLTIPHHTKFISPIDWREFHPDYQRLVEVCSCWGNSEMSGPHSLQAGLLQGHRVGVVGGTDTHFSQPGRSSFGPFDLGGITAVICERLERTCVWDALYSRRCYATTGERILLDFRVNDSPMGSELPLCPERRVTGRIVGTAELDSVDIIRNNLVWRRVPCSGKDEVVFAFNDSESFKEIRLSPEVELEEDFIFYYLRVRQKDKHWAMSSPVWILDARAMR